MITSVVDVFFDQHDEVIFEKSDFGLPGKKLYIYELEDLKLKHVNFHSCSITPSSSA